MAGPTPKFLAMNEFLTMEKAGSLATAQTGQIGFADGAPVIVSAEMPLTDGDNGKVDDATPANNTKGTALCVYRPGWFVGYRRRIAVSVDYLPYYDSLPVDGDGAAGVHQLRQRRGRRAV